MKTIILACIIPGLLMMGCVTIEERLAVLEERNFELEQRLEKQQAKVDEGTARMDALDRKAGSMTQSEDEKDQALRSSLADLHVKLNQMRDEMQFLRGGLEENAFAVKQQLTSSKQSESQQSGRMERVQETVFENKDRLARIEQYLNLEDSKKTASSPGPAPTATASTPDPKPDAPIKKEPTEADTYKAAKASFDRGDFDDARQQFLDFLKSYPKSANADNAQFWIGETYYREKWYEKAILEYQKVIENYPKGNKVQASLLKQGLAFLNLGDRTNSRLILRELVSKYPKANESKIAKQKLKEIK